MLSIPIVAAMNAIGLRTTTPDGMYSIRQEVFMQSIVAALVTAGFVAVVFCSARMLLPRSTSLLIALGTGLGTQAWSSASRSLWTHTWSILLLALAGWHGWMTLSLFGADDPWGRLLDDQPIVSGRHPLHLYHGYLGARGLLSRGRLSCYDPAFQAGTTECTPGLICDPKDIKTYSDGVNEWDAASLTVRYEDGVMAIYGERELACTEGTSTSGATGNGCGTSNPNIVEMKSIQQQ